MVTQHNFYTRVKFGSLLMLMASLPFAIKASNIFLVLSAILSAMPTSEIRRRDFSVLAILALVFLVVEVLSLAYTRGENIKIGLLMIETHLPFLFAPLIFKDVEGHSDRVDYLMIAFVAGCFIASTICVVVNVQLSLIEGKLFHEYYFSHDRVSEPIGMQAVYFALYISLCVLIITDYLIKNFRANSKFKNGVAVILVIYFLVMIIASGARTTIVALMLIMVLNIIAYALINRKYKYLVIASLIPMFFVFMVIFNPVVKTRFLDLRHNQTEGSNYDSYFARLNVWVPGLDVLKDNGWLGVGIGDQQESLNASYTKHNYSAGVEFNLNMHNQYMQVMLGTGVVGLTIFLLMLGIQLVAAIKSRSLLYLSFILLFSMACLTESTLNRNKGVLFFTLFSFIYFAVSQVSFKSSYIKFFKR